jgi:hypothetical protein
MAGRSLVRRTTPPWTESWSGREGAREGGRRGRRCGEDGWLPVAGAGGGCAAEVGVTHQEEEEE